MFGEPTIGPGNVHRTYFSRFEKSPYARVLVLQPRQSWGRRTFFCKVFQFFLFFLNWHFWATLVQTSDQKRMRCDCVAFHLFLFNFATPPFEHFALTTNLPTIEHFYQPELSNIILNISICQPSIFPPYQAILPFDLHLSRYALPSHPLTMRVNHFSTELPSFGYFQLIYARTGLFFMVVLTTCPPVRPMSTGEFHFFN